jgi:hypothetical protein
MEEKKNPSFWDISEKDTILCCFDDTADSIAIFTN